MTLLLQYVPFEVDRGMLYDHQRRYGYIACLQRNPQYSLFRTIPTGIWAAHNNATGSSEAVVDSPEYR